MKSLIQLYEEILFESVEVSKIIANLDNKLKIKINYSGDNYNPAGIRVIHPYLIGRTRRNNLAIRAFQEQGVTKTISPGWKIFLLRRITEWTPLTSNFTIRDDYNVNGDKLFKIINNKI